MQISPSAYEQQRVQSTQHLVELVNSVVDDPQLRLAEKQQFIDNFRRHHPAVYAAHAHQWMD